MLSEDSLALILSSLKQERGFYKSLTTFCVPIVLQNLLSASVGFVDTFMLGMLGQNELAAISLAQTPFFIAMLMMFGLSAGGTILISQYWGKGDMRTISRVLGLTWMCAFILTTGIGTALFMFPHQIMRLLTNNEVLIDIAARYCRIMAYSMVLNSFTIVYIGARRSCGAPIFGTVVVSISAVVNVILNYILIFGNFGAPALGVEGAAIGTLITRTLEVLITIGFIFFADRKTKIMALYVRYLLIPGKVILKDFIRYSLPVLANETLWSVGVSLYIVVYGHMTASSDIMAAFSLAGNIERLVLLVVFCLGHATAVFLGKAIGEGKSPEEVYSLGKTFLALAFTIGLVSGLILIIVAYGIIQPFVFPLLDLTRAAQAICIFMLVSRGILTSVRSCNGTLMIGVLRSGGDVNFILIADVAGIYFWALPLAALFAFVFDLHIYVIFLIILSEDIIKGVLGFWRFRSKKWIKNLTKDIA